MPEAVSGAVRSPSAAVTAILPAAPAYRSSTAYEGIRGGVAPVYAPNGEGQKRMAQGSDNAAGSSRVSKIRIRWQLKALLPVAFVLLNGLLLFIFASSGEQRNSVLGVASGGAVMICVVVLIVLAYVIQRPMGELQEKMSQVGEGDLDASVTFSNQNDEIGDLGRNFNRMVRQLRESKEEIERLHRTQMSRAEHLATLGELAAGLAHEIRNPLAGIAGVIEIVGRDLPATSPAHAVVKDVKQEIAQINRILTDLLECARPRPSQVKVTDLNTTVEHSVMLARQQALSKPIKIELKKAEGTLEIQHDSDQIHQVLLNLLLNSIQAIDRQGSIQVVVSSHDGFAEVSISDSGRGIAPEHLPNIFRPFYTTKGNGTGLGLSLARRIVEDHGGHIEVESAQGQGTRFTVLLPFTRVPAESVS